MRKRRRVIKRRGGRDTRSAHQRELDLGWSGAEQGIERAARHADDDAPGWGDRALVALSAYMQTHPDQSFIAPHVRAWALLHGLDAPEDPHAWGGVFRRAARAKLIRRIGYEQYGDSTTNTQPVTVWKAVDGVARLRA